jgi:hypothetical protein
MLADRALCGVAIAGAQAVDDGAVVAQGLAGRSLRLAVDPSGVEEEAAEIVDQGGETGCAGGFGNGEVEVLVESGAFGVFAIVGGFRGAEQVFHAQEDIFVDADSGEAAGAAFQGFADRVDVGDFGHGVDDFHVAIGQFDHQAIADEAEDGFPDWGSADAQEGGEFDFAQAGAGGDFADQDRFARLR